jgi:hypothetical protein
MQERRAVTKALAERYRKAGKKDKGRMLDEFVAVTGYHRWYAVRLLRWHGRVVRVGRLRLEGDARLRAPRRPRGCTYDAPVATALKKLWLIMDCICGKRLKAVLPELIAVLQRFEEIRLSAEVRAKLQTISPATIDRLLAPERKRLTLRGRSGTKPGTLLKHQIPIRTFAEWNDKRPGFVEIDLVGHDGGEAHGQFCQTLDVTDVMSGWTETQAVINKAQVWVFEALKTIRARVPFTLLGIDSDNGSEFINNHLLRYCQQEQITFTRGRAWKKNDGCFVEQKNYSVVRRAVGYARYDSPKQLRLLNELYGHLRLYANFFLPVMKLTQKTRNGAKVTKTYDQPQTPYQRLIEAKTLLPAQRKQLQAQYALLNPAALKRSINAIQAKLWRSALNPAASKSITAKPTIKTSKHQRANI